jgi:rhodanese-related sulfurtransferase
MKEHKLMIKGGGGRFLLLIPLILLTLGACTSDAEESAGPKSLEEYREPAELKKLVEEGGVEYILVDVRTEMEYESGYIPTAVNIPVQSIEQNPPDVPKDSLVIVYCRSGSRSSRAKLMLEELGYSKVVNFGGILDWPYEVEKP